MSPDTSELSAVGEEKKEEKKNWDYGFIWDIFVLGLCVGCVCVCVCVSNPEHGFSFWSLWMSESRFFFFFRSVTTPCVHAHGVRWCLRPPSPPGASAPLHNLSYHFMKCLPLKRERKDKRLSLCVTRPRWNRVCICKRWIFFVLFCLCWESVHVFEWSYFTKACVSNHLWLLLLTPSNCLH